MGRIGTSYTGNGIPSTIFQDMTNIFRENMTLSFSIVLYLARRVSVPSTKADPDPFMRENSEKRKVPLLRCVMQCNTLNRYTIQQNVVQNTMWISDSRAIFLLITLSCCRAMIFPVSGCTTTTIPTFFFVVPCWYWCLRRNQKKNRNCYKKVTLHELRQSERACNHAHPILPSSFSFQVPVNKRARTERTCMNAC